MLHARSEQLECTKIVYSTSTSQFKLNHVIDPNKEALMATVLLSTTSNTQPQRLNDSPKYQLRNSLFIWQNRKQCEEVNVISTLVIYNVQRMVILFEK